MGHLQPISSSSYSWEFPELYQVYDAEGLSETFVALCLGRVKAPAGVRSPMCLSFENFLLDLGWQGGGCPLRPSFQGTDTSSEVDLGFPMSLPEFPVGGSVCSHNSQTRGILPGCLDAEYSGCPLRNSFPHTLPISLRAHTPCWLRPDHTYHAIFLGQLFPHADALIPRFWQWLTSDRLWTLCPYRTRCLSHNHEAFCLIPHTALLMSKTESQMPRDLTSWSCEIWVVILGHLVSEKCTPGFGAEWTLLTYCVP